MARLSLSQCMAVVAEYYGERNMHYMAYVYGPERAYRWRKMKEADTTALSKWLKDMNRTSVSRFFPDGSRMGQRIKFVIENRVVHYVDGIINPTLIPNPTAEFIRSKLHPAEKNLRFKYYLARALSPFQKDPWHVSRRWQSVNASHERKYWFEREVLARIPFWWVRDYDQVIRTVKRWYGKNWMLEALRDGGCFKAFEDEDDRFGCHDEGVVLFRTRGFKMCFNMNYVRPDKKYTTMSYSRDDKSGKNRDETFHSQLSWYRLYRELWYLSRLPVND